MDVKDIDDAIIVDFIFKVYHRQVVVERRLPSFEDVNLLVRETAPETTGEQFVFKIFLSPDKTDKAVIERQLHCAHKLHTKGFNCSQFLVGDDGCYAQRFPKKAICVPVPEESLSDSCCWCVFYTFLHGCELENVMDASHPVIALELGAFLGLLHTALEDEPSKELDLDPENPWHMGNMKLIQEEEYLQVLENSDARQRLMKILQEVSGVLESSMHALKKGVVHGDFHGLNLIVDKGFSIQLRSAAFNLCDAETAITILSERDKGQSSDKNEQNYTLFHSLEAFKRKNISFEPTEIQQTYGLLDFGEVCYSSHVLEIGRLIADLMVTKMSKQQLQAVNTGRWESETSDVQAVTSSDSHLSSSCTTASDVLCDVSSNGHDKSLKKSMIGEETGDKTRENSLISSSLEETKAISSLCHAPNILHIGGYVLGGYMLTKSLSAAEVDVLKAAVMSSLVQYFVLGKKAMMENPDNSDYSGQCTAEAEILLWQLHGMDKYELYDTWAQALLPSNSLDKTVQVY